MRALVLLFFMFFSGVAAAQGAAVGIRITITGDINQMAKYEAVTITQAAEKDQVFITRADGSRSYCNKLIVNRNRRKDGAVLNAMFHNGSCLMNGDAASARAVDLLVTTRAWKANTMAVVSMPPASVQDGVMQCSDSIMANALFLDTMTGRCFGINGEELTYSPPAASSTSP